MDPDPGPDLFGFCRIHKKLHGFATLHCFTFPSVSRLLPAIDRKNPVNGCKKKNIFTAIDRNFSEKIRSMAVKNIFLQLLTGIFRSIAGSNRLTEENLKQCGADNDDILEVNWR